MSRSLVHAVRGWLWRPRLAALAAFAVGAALTAAVTLWQAQDNAAAAGSRFDVVASRAADQVASRLRTYEYGLRGARGAVIAAGESAITGALYRRYSESRDIEREFPGARGIGVVRRVPAAGEAEFVAAARRAGRADFAVRQIAPQSGDRYVIQYVEPVERNAEAIGLDIASEAHRRAAAESAMRSGQATLSAPITLVQASGLPMRSFLLLLPIYRDGWPLGTAQQREAATFAWSYAPLVIDEVLRDFDFLEGEFSLTLRDVIAADAPTFFASPNSRQSATGGLVQHIAIPLYGRTWEAEVRATPVFFQNLNQREPRLVAAGGAALSALLAVLAFVYAQSWQRALQVQAEQARRSALVETSNDAIVGLTVGGTITDWNRGAERLFGHSALYACGRDIRTLLLPDGHDDEEAAMLAAITRGETVAPFDTLRRHRDGTLIDVSITASPIIGSDGRLLGVSKTLRDISEAARAERRVLELNASLEQQVLDRTARLRASEALLDRAGRVAGVGGWELDLRSNVVTWSAQTYRIHDVDPDYQPTLETAIGFYAPEARPVIERAVAQGMAEGSGWDLELPFVTAKGRSIWVRAVGTVEMDGTQAVRLFGAFQDITARKDAEAALAHERHLMTSLLDTLPDQIYFKDRDSRFLRINPGLARRYGLLDPAEAVGKSDADYFTAEHARFTASVERQIIDSGQPVLDLEEQEFWPDRAPTWNLTTKMPLHDAQGRVVGTFGISRDISARKLIETQLQQTNERFALACDAAGIGVWEYDPLSQSVTWDDWMYRLYGQARHAAAEPYSLWTTSLHPDDLERAEQALSDALKGGQAFDTEFRIIRPDGEMRYLKAAARVLRDASGAALRMTGVNLDITERKRAELELLETSSLLHTVLESASEVSVIATDPDLTIRVFNAGAQRLLGYTPQEVVGRTTPILIHDANEVRARGEELGAQLGREVRGGAVFIEPSTLRQPREWTYVHKDGSRITVSLVVTAMHTERGELLGYLGVAHDVTRQKEYEASLRDAMHKAEQASLAKSQFLANMSHEIRTPMNAVMGLSYLLAQTALDAQQADFLDKIRLASKSLLGVINDVLDLSKIEAGEFTVEHVPFNLRTLLAQLRDLMAVHAEAKGLDFNIDLPPELPSALQGDATRLNQVLVNLLSNAIKFTDKGNVLLRVLACSQSSSSIRLRFEVLDTGIGISSEVQAHLFMPFVQADVSTTRRFGGTGLGLSIVKRLAQLMGGDTGLHSTPGVGSVFHVELPFELAQPESPAFVDSSTEPSGVDRLGGVRVLVVDDSEINLDVARHILELEGAQVEVARHGLGAIERLQAQPGGFDVVLMDVQMPLLDGRQATRRIRDELGLTRLPIIALTAGALTSERQSALAAGMNDFITKPFDVHTLVRSIRRLAMKANDMPERARPRDDDTAGPWPVIEGIDADDVRERLGGDALLFAAMLKRLLAEFADGRLAREAEALPLCDVAARLHKLRGSAGTLGAKGIQQLAGEAEAACRGADAARVATLTVELCRRLQHLAEHAAPVLASMSSRAVAHHASGDGTVDPQAIDELGELLRQQSLSALDRFKVLSPALRHLLGNPLFDAVQEHMDNLRFVDAAKVLDEARAEANA